MKARGVHLRIRVLGSAGSEVPGHNCPAFLIDDAILLDAGTVALSLNIREERRLRWIFITHAHLDHIKGIPFLADNLLTRNTGEPVTLLSGKDVLDNLRKNIFNDEIWPDFSALPSPKRPVLRYRTVYTSRPLELDGYKITMERVHHTVPAYGFIVERRRNKAIAYTGDTGPTERFWKRMAACNVKHLIMETSFPNRLEKVALASGHLTPALLGREIAKMPRVPKKIFIMHVKPQFRDEVEKEIDALGRGNIEFLTDGEVILI
jgi:ribonuclease BN (tRNA processing enzyme)